jgi:hypothetical protein
MLLTKIIKKKKFSNIDGYNFLFFVLLIILSINSTFLDVQRVFEIKFNISINYFISLLNAIRFFFPFLTLLLLLIFIKKTHYTKIFEHKFYLLFIFYFLFQLLVYSKFYLEHDWSYIQLASNGFIFSLICLLSLKENFKYFYKNILIIAITIFSTLSLYLSFQILYQAIDIGNSYLYWSSALSPTGTILGTPNPRVTGLSRTLLIFFVLLFFSIQRFNKVIKILAYITLFYITFVLYGMQTRGAMIGLIIFLFIYLFFVSDLFLIKTLKIFLLILLPIILWENLIANKILHNVSSVFITQDDRDDLNDRDDRGNQDDLNDRDDRGNQDDLNDRDDRGTIFLYTEKSTNSRIFNDGKIKLDTSGRVEIWKLALKLIKDNKVVFGFGPQGDRQLFNFYKQKKINTVQSIKWSTNVSNGYIYSYLSAGILGLSIALIATIILIKEVFVAVFINKIFRKNIDQNYLSIFCIIFLSTRTLFENGLFYFSVDYIFILISYLNVYIFNNNLKNNIIK